MEQWKIIPIAQNYEVSDLGNIRKIKPSKTGPKTGPTIWNDKDGYEQVSLTVNGRQKQFRLHRLIALTFLGESPYQVHHKNGVKADNKLDNLEYVTPAQNRWHGTVAIDANKPRGKDHHNSKLNEHQVEAIHALRELKWSGPKIAKVIGCTASNVYCILHGKGWAHIEPTQLEP